jgi:regulator of CtrA degradation
MLWHTHAMIIALQEGISRRLVDSLYVEAMLLADEARGYFDAAGRADRDVLPPVLRVGFSCESLRVTTRLMHVIAWLLARRALASGEITEEQASAPERRLGHVPESDPDAVEALPRPAQQIIVATEDLYARVLRLDSGIRRTTAPESPVLSLMGQLERAFGSSRLAGALSSGQMIHHAAPAA